MWLFRVVASCYVRISPKAPATVWWSSGKGIYYCGYNSYKLLVSLIKKNPNPQLQVTDVQQVQEENNTPQSIRYDSFSARE